MQLGIEYNKQTLQPIGRVHTIVLDSFFVRIRQSIQDDVYEDIEPHVRCIPQCLYYHARQIVIGHNLVDCVGEEDARIAVCNLRDRSAQRVDGVMR